MLYVVCTSIVLVVTYLADFFPSNSSTSFCLKRRTARSNGPCHNLVNPVIHRNNKRHDPTRRAVYPCHALLYFIFVGNLQNPTKKAIFPCHVLRYFCLSGTLPAQRVNTPSQDLGSGTGRVSITCHSQLQHVAGVARLTGRSKKTVAENATTKTDRWLIHSRRCRFMRRRGCCVHHPLVSGVTARGKIFHIVRCRPSTAPPWCCLANSLQSLQSKCSNKAILGSA